MIYTKTGDGGTTSLVGGTRVSKCHPRVEAYGTVDELNAHIGLLAEMIRDIDSRQFDLLEEVQQRLFVVQTLLATEKEVPFQLPQLPDTAVDEIERHIDELQAQLPPFRSFVMPGGTLPSAQCHVATTASPATSTVSLTISLSSHAIWSSPRAQKSPSSSSIQNLYLYLFPAHRKLSFAVCGLVFLTAYSQLFSCRYATFFVKNSNSFQNTL